MGKKVTFTSTRANPETPWYYETAAASNNQSWNNRLQFMLDNNDIDSSVTSTDTTLTSVVTFTNENDYNDFSSLTQTVMNDVIAYCNQNNITYNVVIEDV